MLGRIGNTIGYNDCKASMPETPPNWKRDEIDDTKKAIEYLYEFKEKLSKLHPISQEVIEKILTREYYR